jgi:AraC-like DNA-binding protein/mannose-6-phosphate isomerase-like protein (cupin superfamily)
VNLEEYVQYHETKQHGKPGFSYNTYLCTIPLDFDHVELHWHRQMELIYVKSGEGSVTAGAETYEVSEGCIIPVMPSELHAISGKGDSKMEYENIIFQLDLLDSTEQDDWCREQLLEPLKRGTFPIHRPIRPGEEGYLAAASALDDADRACMNPRPGYQLIIKSCLFRFLNALYENRGDESVPGKKVHSDMLKRVLLYIQEHFREPITIEDASAQSRYSAGHFMRVFREETGTTFNQYLIAYRLRYASYLLRETEETVTSVAGQCGFDNISYFIRMFRREYGQTPARYRKS